MAAKTITAILVSLIVTADSQYQYPSEGQQNIPYPTETDNFYQSAGQYKIYQSPQVTTQQNDQLFTNGARSSTTFNFGQRRVALQVNHHASQPLINSFGTQHYNQQDGRILNQVSQGYQTQNNPQFQNNLPILNGNQQNTVQDPYTLVNPINGQKYSVNQPEWDHSAYNLNINYNNQGQRILNKPSQQTQPAHNFHFNNGFAQQPNYLGQQALNGFYRRPAVGNLQTGYNTAIGQSQAFVQSPHRGYEVNDPNQPKITHKLVYTRPSGTLNNDHPQVNNAIESLSQLPRFESGRVVTKEKTVRNFTVITRIDEEIEENVTPSLELGSSVSDHSNTTPIEESLPIVEDAKLKFLPRPTIAQPQQQGQFYESLFNTPDYTTFYRTVPKPHEVNLVQHQNQNIQPTENTILQPTSGLVSSEQNGENIQSPGQQQNQFIYQTTPNSQQQNQFIYQTTPNSQQQNYVFYQTTPSSQSAYTINNNEGNIPLPVNQQSPVYEQTTEKLETLLSVNGFEETETEIASEGVTNDNIGVVTEEELTARNEAIITTENDKIFEATTTSPESTATINQFEESISSSINDPTHFTQNGYLASNVFPGNPKLSSIFTQNANSKSNFRFPTSAQEINGLVSRNQDDSSQIVNEASISNRNEHYNVAQVTTPSFRLEGEQFSRVTESSVSAVSGTPDQNIFSSTSSDIEATKRVKKIRVFKKPSLLQLTTGEEQPVTDRGRKAFTESVEATSQRGLINAPTPVPSRGSSRFRGNIRHNHNGIIPSTTNPPLRRRPITSRTESGPIQPTVSQQVDDFVQHPANQQINPTFPQQTFSKDAKTVSQEVKSPTPSSDTLNNHHIHLSTPQHPDDSSHPQYNVQPTVLTAPGQLRSHNRVQTSPLRGSTAVPEAHNLHVHPEISEENIQQTVLQNNNPVSQQSAVIDDVIRPSYTTENSAKNILNPPSINQNNNNIYPTTLRHRMNTFQPRFHFVPTAPTTPENLHDLNNGVTPTTFAQEPVNYGQHSLDQDSLSHHLIQPTVPERTENLPERTAAPHFLPTVPAQIQHYQHQAVESHESSTQAISEIQSQTNGITEEITTENIKYFVTPTRTPLRERVTQRARTRISVQRPTFRSSYRESGGDPGKPGTYSINGRLRVTNPENLEASEQQPNERRHRYHIAKQIPQRQVIRRFKVKMDRRTESFIKEDQDASGSVRTGYVGNDVKDNQEKSVVEEKTPNHKYRKTFMFPPRKVGHFGPRTTTIADQEINTESTFQSSTDEISQEFITGSPYTSIEHVTTESTNIHFESTTTRVTEKRQIVDDQLAQDLTSNDQNSQFADEKSDGLRQSNLFIIKEINLRRNNDEDNLHSESIESLIPDNESVEDSNAYFNNSGHEANQEEIHESLIKPSESGNDESDLETYEPLNIEETIIPTNPEHIISSSLDPQLVPVPSANPEPVDPVTKIEIVTSISEMNNRKGPVYLRKVDMIPPTVGAFPVDKVY